MEGAPRERCVSCLPSSSSPAGEGVHREVLPAALHAAADGTALSSGVPMNVLGIAHNPHYLETHVARVEDVPA